MAPSWAKHRDSKGRTERQVSGAIAQASNGQSRDKCYLRGLARATDCCQFGMWRGAEARFLLPLGAQKAGKMAEGESPHYGLVGKGWNQFNKLRRDSTGMRK